MSWMRRRSSVMTMAAGTAALALFAGCKAPVQEKTANRRRRSFWFDPRFAVGLLLVAVSVAGAPGKPDRRVRTWP